MAAGAEGRVRAGKLHRFLSAVFEKLDLPGEDAAWTARTLVQAELRGVTSHGVIRMPQYVKRLEVGLANPRPRVRVEKDAGALALLDGDNGMGQVVSRRAMEACIARAEAHNVGVVLLKESNHFGAAGTYAAMAAERGMVGLCTTNTISVMAPWGAKAPRIGNNPIAVAVPADPPMVLDMALSAVARGYIIEAARAGRAIPEGWGLDGEGAPTTDPAAVLESSLLSPIAGHKGSGLSVAIDAVLSSLAGAPQSPDIVGIHEFTGKSRVTHLFGAIRIEALVPLDAFRAAADGLFAMLRAAPRAAGVERIYTPGEIEHARAREREKGGIRLPAERFAELGEIAAGLGVAPLAPLEEGG